MRCEMTRIGNIMTKEVLTVTEGTTIKDVCRLLGEFNLSAIPVISEEGNLLGIVSEKSIIAHQVASLEPDFVDPDIYELISSKYLGEDDFNPGQDRMYVEEIMNRDVITVTPDISIEGVSHILLEHGLHRLPVIEEGKVVGIISSLDLLKAKYGRQPTTNKP
jgi:CBS domain-containing protein